MNWKTGDVVRLKSGGPIMTVSYVKGDEIWCVWFGGDTDPRRYEFKPDMLEPVKRQ